MGQKTPAVRLLEDLFSEAGLLDRPLGVRELSSVAVEASGDQLVLRLRDGRKIKLTVTESTWERCQGSDESQTPAGPVVFDCDQDGVNLLLGVGEGWFCDRHAVKEMARG